MRENTGQEKDKFEFGTMISSVQRGKSIASLHPRPTN